MTNHGVKLGRRQSDYMAGAFTFISYEERNPSGNWKDYLPTKEVQFGSQDSMSCVSFSAINAIEIQEKFLTGHQNNWSDRWIAKMSNTQPDGNYLYIVADAIRQYGLVPEEKYPAPPGYTWAEYHAAIPEPKLTELKREGKFWLNEWDFRYEFIPATKKDMLHHIKHAPLQIVIPGHAIVNFLCEEDIVRYFDTYNPHEKTTSYANIQSVMKPLLTRKQMAKRFIINDGGKIGVAVIEGFTGTIVFAKDQESLANLKKALEVPEDAPTFNYPN